MCLLSEPSGVIFDIFIAIFSRADWLGGLTYLSTNNVWRPQPHLKR